MGTQREGGEGGRGGRRGEEGGDDTDTDTDQNYRLAAPHLCCTTICFCSIFSASPTVT